MKWEISCSNRTKYKLPKKKKNMVKEVSSCKWLFNLTDIFNWAEHPGPHVTGHTFFENQKKILC